MVTKLLKQKIGYVVFPSHFLDIPLLRNEA